MRLLVVAPFLPDPHAAHGGGMYLGVLCAHLAAFAELALVALQAEPAPIPQDLWRWSATLPHLGRAAGSRSRHLLRMAWLWGACRKPLVVAKTWHPQLPALLRKAGAEFAPDAVLLEMAVMAQYLPWLVDLPTVLTDHEAGAPAQSRTDLGAFADHRDLRLWRHYVQRFYPRASLLQAVTAEDAVALDHELGRPVALRRPVVAVPAHAVLPAHAKARALFLGDYRHEPNPVAARILAREVWPLVMAAVPTAELWLAGPNEQRIDDLRGLPGIRICGFAPDLSALFAEVRCLLAPLYSGSGFRVKGLTALAHGLPVITNQLGARGADAPAAARVVVETATELAAATVHWLQQPVAAGAAGSAARSWAEQHLGGAAVAKDQLTRIERLLQQRRRPG